MKSNSLELDGLRVARDGETLIHGLTHRLDAGEVLVIRGHNGAGKSTLLKTLAGLMPPAGGEIRLNGHPLSEVRPRPLFIGHKRGLEPSMSVADNVRFWSRASGNDELYAAALHYFDLEGLESIRLGSLSAGWQARVALARLITVPAHLWLLDEPMAHLDEQGLRLLHQLIETRCEQKGMVVLTSHVEIQGDKVKSLNISELLEQAEVIH